MEQKGWVMPYWIHCDRQAQLGDLRRIQILTSEDLSLRQDLRGPFRTLHEAIGIAESLLWSVVASIMERLRTEPPRRFAAFPLGQVKEE